MPRKSSLLTPALVGPSAGPFGSMGGIRKPRKAFKRGGKFATGGENDPLAKAVPPVPKAPPSPFTYYSPEAKAARHEGLLQSVTRRNDAEERLKKAYRGLQDSQGATGVPNYKRGGTFKKGSDLPHFFLGDLFGGTPAKTQSTTTQSGSTSGGTNNNITDPAYNQLRGNVLTAANNLDFSDPSKYIAGFNADQQNAFQNIRNNQGVYQGNYDQAQGDFNQASAADPTGAGMGYIDKAGGLQTGSEAFNPFAQQASQGANTTVGNYMSPYQQQAMNAVGQASNTAFGAPGGPMERINDTFTGGAAAQFGRERHGDVMGNAVYNQQQALNQQLAQMANTGWQSGLTAATADQNRLASLGQTAGTLANQDIQTQQGLGTAATDITAKGAATNIAAGNAQQALGTARQGAGYTDVNALLSAGNQQQQLEQQQKSMPLQGLQYQQSLGQGWQLPTSSDFANFQNSSSQGSGSQSSPQGSPFGQVVGAGAALAGAVGTGSDSNTVQNQQPAGQNPYNVKVNSDGTTTTATAARGGQINPFYFSAGGYVPTVTGVRKRNAMRKPPASPMGPMGGMGGMQPTGMPGMPPQAPPTAGALNPQPQPPQPMPHPANRKYARGGPFDGDAAQDRAMVERGVHQHERQMHKATTGELTKLRLARGGGVPGFLGGGDVGGGFGPGSWLSIGKDLYGTGDSIFNYQGEKESPQSPMDPLSNIWEDFEGGEGNKREMYGQGEQIGHNAGRVVGDVVGNIVTPGFGSIWAEALGRIGSGVGALFEGKPGEAWNDVTEGTPLTFINLAKGGSTTPGVFGGDDRETLDEDAPQGPFGNVVRLVAPGRSEAKFIPFGPLPTPMGFASPGSGGSSGGGSGGLGGLGNITKMLGSLFGGDSTTPNTAGSVGTDTGGWGTPDIDTEIADWSSYGGDLGSSGFDFARGGRVPRYATGSGVMASSLPTLDEKASSGPFGDLKLPQIGPSTANFGQFGPMPAGGGGGGGGSGGGGGGGGETAGGLMGGIGGLLGGVAKIIPFLSHGGRMPGYAAGGTDGFLGSPDGSSQFLDSSEGLDQRLLARDQAISGSPFLRSSEGRRSMTLSPEERYALRQQRLAQNNERLAGYEQEARSDLPGYWKDMGRQGLHGIADMAQIAGIPGSVNNAIRDVASIEGRSSLPTMGGIREGVDNLFGPSKFGGGDKARQAGSWLTNAFGVGSADKLIRATQNARRASVLFPYLGDALNAGTMVPSMPVHGSPR